MSASNWRACPACLRRADEEQAEKRALADAMYGKASQEEYEAAMEDANKPVEVEDCLREDYQIGVDECGDFSVGYSANCQRCDFQYSFNKTVTGVASDPDNFKRPEGL